MAININSNFKVGSPEPLDTRFQFETLQKMKDFDENVLYDGVLAYNLETDKYYTFNTDNLAESILGKWREFAGGSDIIFFNTKAEWEGAKLAGELDPDKYYAYPPEKTDQGGGEVPSTPIIYFSGKAAYEVARDSGQLDEGTYYSWVGGLAKGSLPIVEIDDKMSDTSENTVQNRVINEAIKNSSIVFLTSYDEWERMRLDGKLDPNKYYSYPTDGSITHVIDAISMGLTSNEFTVENSIFARAEYIIEKGFVYFSVKIDVEPQVPPQSFNVTNFIPTIKDPGMTIIAQSKDASATQRPVLTLSNNSTTISIEGSASSSRKTYYASGSYVVADGWRA